MNGEREIPTSTARSLWCQDMLVNIYWVMRDISSSMSSMSDEWEYIVKLLRLSTGNSWVFFSKAMKSVFELGAGELSF